MSARNTRAGKQARAAERALKGTWERQEPRVLSAPVDPHRVLKPPMTDAQRHAVLTASAKRDHKRAKRLNHLLLKADHS